MIKRSYMSLCQSFRSHLLCALLLVQFFLFRYLFLFFGKILFLAKDTCSLFPITEILWPILFFVGLMYILFSSRISNPPLPFQEIFINYSRVQDTPRISLSLARDTLNCTHTFIIFVFFFIYKKKKW